MARPVAAGTSYGGQFFYGCGSVEGTLVEAEAGYGLFFGVCGPSWATRMNVEGSYGDSSTAGQSEIDLARTGDVTQAGLVLGASV